MNYRVRMSYNTCPAHHGCACGSNNDAVQLSFKKKESNVLSLVMYCDYTVLIFKHATMSPPPGP